MPRSILGPCLRVHLWGNRKLWFNTKAKPRLQFPKNFPPPLLPLFWVFSLNFRFPVHLLVCCTFHSWCTLNTLSILLPPPPGALGLAITSPRALPCSRHPSTESLPNFPWTISLQVTTTHSTWGQYHLNSHRRGSRHLSHGQSPCVTWIKASPQTVFKGFQ